MALVTDFFDPAYLSGYARAALRDWPINQPSLAQWLPFKTVDDIEFRFTRGDNGLVQLAPFRAYDAESSIGGRKGLSRVTQSLPPISRKRVLGEYDQLVKRNNSDQLIRDAIIGDVELIVAEIAMSFEYEMGDALQTGTVTPPGLLETVTFNRSANNQTIANVYWSNEGSSDPIRDLKSWVRYYVKQNGTAPGTTLMSEDSLNWMLQSLAVRALAGNIVGTPTVIDEAVLATILTRNRIPPIETYEVSYDPTGNGGSARILPNSSVFLLPPKTDPNNPAGTKLGATVVGTTLEASKPNYNLADAPAGIVVGNYEDEDPAGIWTKGNAIGMVQLMNPDLSFRATVGAY